MQTSATLSECIMELIQLIVDITLNRSPIKITILLEKYHAKFKHDIAFYSILRHLQSFFFYRIKSRIIRLTLTRGKFPYQLISLSNLYFPDWYVQNFS